MKVLFNHLSSFWAITAAARHITIVVWKTNQNTWTALPTKHADVVRTSVSNVLGPCMVQTVNFKCELDVLVARVSQWSGRQHVPPRKFQIGKNSSLTEVICCTDVWLPSSRKTNEFPCKHVIRWKLLSKFANCAWALANFYRSSVKDFALRNQTDSHHGTLFNFQINYSQISNTKSCT